MFKPCPFCGGLKVQRAHAPDGKPDEMGKIDWAYWIFCVNCGASGPYVKSRKTPEQDARESWNGRV